MSLASDTVCGPGATCPVNGAGPTGRPSTKTVNGAFAWSVTVRLPRAGAGDGASGLFALVAGGGLGVAPDGGVDPAGGAGASPDGAGEGEGEGTEDGGGAADGGGSGADASTGET